MAGWTFRTWLAECPDELVKKTPKMKLLYNRFFSKLSKETINQ
jgi:hypothetical protein